MKISQDNELRIEDTKQVRHVLVRVELKTRKTVVMSNFSAWENMSLLLEAVGATGQQCIAEGMSRLRVVKAARHYLEKIIRAYLIK